jgi:hypothetical protein
VSQPGRLGRITFVVGALRVTEVVVFVVVLAVIFALIFAPGAITVAKGHVALFVAGMLFGPIWLIAAFRLAKPNSPWARRYYGPEKLERSESRYPDIEVSAPSRAGLAATIGFGLMAAVIVAGVIAGST